MGIIDEVPFGATLTIVADCCYSGSLIYGPGFGDWAHKFAIPKNIRPSTLVSTTQSMGGIERNGVTLEMLAQEIKAMHHIECDDIATLFLRVFGEDARLLFPSVPKVILLFNI
ncbi:Uncharacterized protein Fot_52550 [Forsythia ovata]|uniref:Uncharacterized protein n=1 Tax=Forsythia ovata TaxID=205694 RepID=A0ABD1PLX1_9LAMI